jgi:hypothetical protein
MGEDMTDECFERFRDWVGGVYDGPIRNATMSQTFRGMELDNLESDSLWKGWKACWNFQINRTRDSLLSPVVDDGKEGSNRP